MYKLIWDHLGKMEIKRKYKQRIFIGVNVLLYGVLATILWFLFGMKMFDGDAAWFISFVGYPTVLLGFAGSIFALFKLDQ